MTHEHHSRNFPSEWLQVTFYYMAIGNTTTAIGAGVISSLAVNVYGYSGPYIIICGTSIAIVLYLIFTWSENYGDVHNNIVHSTKAALNQIRGDKDILILGCIQCLFDSAMYAFVFLWTPELTRVSDQMQGNNSIFHGIIFSCFMVSISVGSTIFASLSLKWRVQYINQINLVMAAISMLIPVLTQNATAVFLAFNLFEVCCGIYFPSMGIQRNLYLPNETRTTIMSIYRVGINILVIIILKLVSFI